ncbi:MAG TPA: FtsQ-type POTRA domain-containing protein [Verrucomicrobiae bacterium]|nr:FtsQ-type POTRA domain-containing protein [Verrucomicrobiae bacterium]
MRAESLPLAPPASPLRVVGWSLAVMLIAFALMPLVPRLGATRTAVVLEVSGELKRVDAEAVRLAVAGHLNRDFHELDLAAVKAAVEALPWVARARVERAWPETVRVRLWEHHAVARWNDSALLSDADVVFTPDGMPADLGSLPRLAGPEGRQATVREAFEALRERLADTPFAPARLTQNERGAWTAVTADGVELRLGRGAPTDAVVALAGPVRSALEGRLQEVTYVDLHYINGFAVGWRQPVADDGARSPGDGAEEHDE